MSRSQRLAAGELDQRITIQHRVTTENSLGEKVLGDWEAFATVWAAVRPLRSRELFAAGQAQMTVDVRLAIRWLAGVTGQMRVIWRSQPHEIVGEPIDVDAGRHTLELQLVKGIRDGREKSSPPAPAPAPAPSEPPDSGLDFVASDNSQYVPILEDI